MKVPQHIAIIMDGNGRWAEKMGFSRTAGHKAGMESIKATLNACRELGVKVLTVYAFSTENWRRSKIEIRFLMNYLKDFLIEYESELNKKDVRLNTIGQFSRLPALVKKELSRVMEKTRSNQGLIFNLALSYGGRAEIIEAVRKLIEDLRAEKIRLSQINEDVFSQYLYTDGLPDPDLLIRTGGEMRISNFLLWQISYSELYVTPTFWPDFRRVDLIKAVTEYSRRKRRFGGVKNAG
ncbi:MAG: isoprenyl transferase [Candidatus Omnitrophota bacterium]|nr:isoprenyl transferase [Candidatus Omnitrophota bacterium]